MQHRYTTIWLLATGRHQLKKSAVLAVLDPKRCHALRRIKGD